MEKNSKASQSKDKVYFTSDNTLLEDFGTVKVTKSPEEVVGTILKFMGNVKTSLDNCFNEDGPYFAMEIPDYKQGYIDIKKRGAKVRVITRVTKNNVQHCKNLEKIVDEVRHLDKVEGGIALSDSEYMTTTMLDKSKLLTQIVHTDIPEAVLQQQNFFNNLWEKAVPAKQKIRDILYELDESHNNIFSALDNPIRRSIMFYLRDGNLKISQLAKKLDITMQAIHKHYEKLIETGFIQKNSEGMVSLTESGSAFLKQLPSMRFLFENKEFFKTHSLSFLPTKFVQRLGDLQDFELITGVIPNIEKCQDLLFADKFVKFIGIPVYLNPNNEDFAKLFKSDLDLQYILAENSDLPRGWNDFTKKVDEKELISQGKVQRKMMTSSPIMMFVSENSAALIFPDLEGNPDVNSILYSKDSQFIDWCVDLFDDMWGKSNTFVEGKIREY